MGRLGTRGDSGMGETMRTVPHAIVLTAAALIALTACTPTSTPSSSSTPPPRTCPDEGPKYPWVTAAELRDLTGEEVLRRAGYGNSPSLGEVLLTRQKVTPLWEKVYPSDGVALPATFPDPDGAGTVTYRLVEGLNLFFYYDGQWHRARPVSDD